MNIFDRIRSFEFDRNETHIYGIKSGIVWGHSKETNSCSPILYISKPKGVSQEDFELLLDCLELKFLKK